MTHFRSRSEADNDSLYHVMGSARLNSPDAYCIYAHIKDGDYSSRFAIPGTRGSILTWSHVPKLVLTVCPISTIMTLHSMQSLQWSHNELFVWGTSSLFHISFETDSGITFYIGIPTIQRLDNSLQSKGQMTVFTNIETLRLGRRHSMTYA